MKLRLLVTKECNRNCEGCCNKDWNLDDLPIFDLEEADKYDEILITGGEPVRFEFFVDLLELISKLRQQTDAKIFIYTASKDVCAISAAIVMSDGITLTLHDSSDFKTFAQLDKMLDCMNVDDKSLRLNVFLGVQTPETANNWKIKNNIEWIKDCSLPKGEEFKRLETLWSTK